MIAQVIINSITQLGSINNANGKTASLFSHPFKEQSSFLDRCETDGLSLSPHFFKLTFIDTLYIACCVFFQVISVNGQFQSNGIWL